MGMLFKCGVSAHLGSAMKLLSTGFCNWPRSHRHFVALSSPSVLGTFHDTTQPWSHAGTAAQVPGCQPWLSAITLTLR